MTDRPTTPAYQKGTPERRTLEHRRCAIIVGHDPGGGAEGERQWNIELAKHLSYQLQIRGAMTMIYHHRLRPYGARQRAMAAAVVESIGRGHPCIELHYNAVESPDPKGHHFQYRGYPSLAASIRDHWQRKYPESIARRDNGTFHNIRGNGSGFLRMAPGPACLVEPFFRSNPEEWEFYRNRQREVAEVYALGIEQFLRS